MDALLRGSSRCLFCQDLMRSNAAFPGKMSGVPPCINPHFLSVHFSLSGLSYSRSQRCLISITLQCLGALQERLFTSIYTKKKNALISISSASRRGIKMRMSDGWCKLSVFPVTL